jgi:hypothetical protein
MTVRAPRTGARRWLLALAVSFIVAGAVAPARAGGPTAIVNHSPVVYPNGGSALTLNLDQGPLGARNNAQAVGLVQSALDLWNGVGTSTLRLTAGTPLPVDYTAANYGNVFQNISDGINPVLFDTDGSIVDAILGAGQRDYVLGFAGSSYYTGGPQAGRFIEGRAVINGYLSVPDTTLTIVLAHEFGHFFGLDHAQLDDSQGLAPANFVLMYPIAHRTSMSLHEDDAAAVTSLYPAPSAAATYGRLTGTFTTAGGTPVLGANLWARDTVSGKVYSVVSDYLLQNTGYFSLSLPAGNYTLNAESVQASFNGGSGVGPYADTGSDVSFQAPHPIAPVAFGGGGSVIAIAAGCVATATFRLDGTGSVGGNCTGAAMPGTGTVVANPYGAISVQGGSLNGNTISALQNNAVIQLGATAGAAGSFAQIDFQGLDIGAGRTLSIRAGALGQTVVLRNTSAAGSVIAGVLQALGGSGAVAPVLHLHNASGITVAAGGSVFAPSGLISDALGASWTTGAPVVNQGTLDGGASLRVLGARVNGGGAFKGNAVFIGTFGNANNPVNGAHFLANGLQLWPSTGNTVALTLNHYGAAPQVLNVQVNGNASAAMPSAWPGGVTSPTNNRPVLQGGTRPPGTPLPGYGGGSMIVQATGTLSLVGGVSNDFVFPGGVVLKAGGNLDLKGVAVTNGWTTSGQSFQGIFLESPNIVSTGGNLRVLTSNLNWVNFSTMPHAPVRAWTLVAAADGSASYATADAVAPHLNTYSVLTEAAAAGQCYLCLTNMSPVPMY